MPGFKTSVQLLSFNVDEDFRRAIEGNTKVVVTKAKQTETKCFENFNFQLNQVIMQPANTNVAFQIFVPKANKDSPAHTFECGTTACTLPVQTDRVENLRVQEHHTDGPRMYDSHQFKSDGSLKADARHGSAADTDIPPDILRGPNASKSVLLAFFKNTLLGIPKVTKRGRPNSGPAVANPTPVPLGTGNVFLFDLFHQVNESMCVQTPLFCG